MLLLSLGLRQTALIVRAPFVESQILCPPSQHVVSMRRVRFSDACVRTAAAFSIIADQPCAYHVSESGQGTRVAAAAELPSLLQQGLHLKAWFSMQPNEITQYAVAR